MAIGARAAGILEEIARQIGLGRPEEVAERIAEGRLDMRPEAVAERQQDLFPDIFYTGTTSPDILDIPSSLNEIGTGAEPQFLYMSKSPALAASYSGKKQGRFADESPAVYPFAVDTTRFDRLLGDRKSWNALQNPRIELGGDPSNVYIAPGIGYQTDDIAQLSYELGSPGLIMQDVIDPGPYTKLMRMGLQGKKGDASQFEFDNFLRELEQAPPVNAVVPDTTRVRSLLGAAFDPEYKGSNILGERAIPVAGAGLLAAAAMSPEEAEAGPLSAAARAAQQGFTNKQYHASMQDFDRIVPGYDDGLFFTTPNPEFASDWAGKGKLQNREGELDSYDRYRPQKEKLYEEMGSPEFGTPEYDEFVNRSSEIYRQEQNAFKTVYPLLARTEKTFDPEKNFDDIADLFDEGRLNAPFSAEYPTFADALKGGNYILYENPEVVGHLKSKGYDSMFLRESTGSKEAREAPYTTVAHFYPDRNIRSQFAEFAEGYTGPSILGGTAAGALGLTALMAPEEAEAKTPEFLASLPQLEPYEPSLVDSAVQNVAQFLKDIGATESDYTANQMASSLSDVADFTPVIGDAKGFAETKDLIEEGSYGEAAVSGLLAALGLIPIGGDIAAAALKGALPLPFSVNRDTSLLQRVGDPESVNDMRLDVEPGVELAPSKRLSAEDLEGRGFVSGMADTSLGDLSRVLSVNDQPVDMVRFGGQDYMRQPQNIEQGILWASDAGAITGLTNAARAAAQLPNVSRSPVYIPYQMGATSTDFATMTADVMVPIARQNMNKTEKKALDKRIREGAGNKTNEFKPQPDWPGIDSPEADKWLANAGGNRKAITKAIDEFRDSAGINLSQARAAIVDPTQLNPRVGNLRQAGVLDLMQPAQAGIHPSYNTDLMGTYLGEFGEGANLLSDLNPLIRSSGKPFVPEMLARGHDLAGDKLPAPVGKAMQAGLIGAFDQATLDELIKKGLIAP